jgi:hypothetical protein
MWSGAIDSLRQTVEHIADVADKGFGNRRCIDPARSGFYLQAARIILQENGEQSVIRVLPNAPWHVSILGRWRIVEDAKQNEWIV